MNTYKWRTGALSLVGVIALSSCFLLSYKVLAQTDDLPPIDLIGESDPDPENVPPNVNCTDLNNYYAGIYTYALKWEDSAVLLQRANICEVISNHNAVNSSCTTFQPPAIYSPQQGDKLTFQHTHPLAATSDPALGSSRLSQDDRQAVCDGTRIPPAMQPSGSDWRWALDTVNAPIPGVDVEFKVYDPGGVWTYGVQNPSHPAVQILASILTGSGNPISILTLPPEQVDAVNDVVVNTNSPRPTGTDLATRNARIAELEAQASLIGLRLQYTPNAYTNGEVPIPFCDSPVPSDDELYFGPGASGDVCALQGIGFSMPDDSDPDPDPDPATTTPRSIFSNLVPCGINTKVTPRSGGGYTYEDECTICHLQVLAQNVLRFIVAISIAVAALMFANAGFLYVSSPGNAGNISRAHHLFTNTLMGIIIILVAFLLIDTILKMTLPNQDGVGSVYKSEGVYGPWNKILCGEGGPKGSHDVEGIDPVIITVPGDGTVPLPETCQGFGGTCVGGIGACPTGTHVQGQQGGTQLCPWGEKCCVPATAGGACRTQAGVSGVCLTESGCTSVNAGPNDSCATGFVCCTPNIPDPGTSVTCAEARSEITRVGGRNAVAGASCTCTNRVQQRTLDAILQMIGTYGGGNCVVVTSLSCGTHSTNSKHYQGLAFDIRGRANHRCMINHLENTWTPGPTWRNGTPTYTNSAYPGLTCANEKFSSQPHIHCQY